MDVRSYPHGGQMELREALECALAGQAILFAGAGFSTDATNIRGKSLPNSKQFAAHLNAFAGLPDAPGLEDIAEECARWLGRRSQALIPVPRQ